MNPKSLTYTVTSGVCEVFVMAEETVEARRAYIRSVRASFEDKGRKGRYDIHTAGGSWADRVRAGEQEEELSSVGSGSMLKARLLLSVFLFAAFVFCDKTGEKLLTLTADEVCERLEENYDYTKLEKYVMMASDVFSKEVEDEPSGIK